MNNDMWTCEDGSQCIHYSLVCDGHIQCNDESDEALSLCGQCPLQLELNDTKIMKELSQAIFQCKHRFTGRPICAIPCNNRDEFCSNYEDEQSCFNKIFLPMVVTVSCLLVVTFIVAEIFFRIEERHERFLLLGKLESFLLLLLCV